MQNKSRYLAGIAAALVVIAVALWGPEWIADRHDEKTMNRINTETVKGAAGYCYSMNGNQKLYLLGQCLDSQKRPETELSALTRVDADSTFGAMTGNYAFVENRQDVSDEGIPETEVFRRCNEEIDTLKELGILPKEVIAVEEDAYDAVLCSAIDVLEPRNNLAVWKISLSTDVKNADKTNRFLDIYMDADTGNIYEFYVRTSREWENIDTERMITQYEEYLGLTGRTAYENPNPLLETTPDFQKYTFPGGDKGSVTVTIGFYEGIRELFLKVGN